MELKERHISLPSLRLISDTSDNDTRTEKRLISFGLGNSYFYKLHFLAKAATHLTLLSPVNSLSGSPGCNRPWTLINLPLSPRTL